MRRVIQILILTLLLSVVSPVSSRPSTRLDIDCGPLQRIEDQDGRYLLFQPTGTFTFVGNRVVYKVYFTNKRGTSLRKQSRITSTVTFSGGVKKRTDEFSVEKSFRDSFLERDYYSSDFLEFTITAEVKGQRLSKVVCRYEM